MPSVMQRYHVIPGADVTVRAMIGDGQAGGHAIFVGTTQVGGGAIVAAANLGAGATLVGKRLVLSSVAVDIHPSHDHVSVSVVLSGGSPDPFPVVMAADATPGGTVSFLTVVDFA